MQDVRQSVRMLVKNPGFAATAVLTLGLAIGANTSLFTVLNAVVLQGLPYPSAERLAVVWVDFGENGQSLPASSALDFRDYRQMTTRFEDFAAGTTSTANLTGGGEPEQVELGRITHNFFPLLRVEPALGRTFSASEDVMNGPAVVILSHGLWQRRFGSDPNIVGRTIQINGAAHDVVGVMPRDFELLLPREAFLKDSQLWAPLQDPYQGPRNRTLLTVLGRLAPGVSFEEAQREMESVAARLRQEHLVHTQSDTRIRVVALHHDAIKNVRPALVALFAAVGLVLLIACGNVANLMLARAAARQREIALRASLGADRRRIVRQLLTESLVLSVTATSVGVLFALWGTELLLSLQPTHLARLRGATVDESAFAFTAAVCLLTVVLCGLLPAIQASRPGLYTSLREGGRGPRLSPSLRRVLVAGEVALSLVLLVGFGLLLRSFVLLSDVRPGFDPENVLTFRISLPANRYGSPQDRVLFHDRLRESLAAIPGVRSSGAVSQMPLTGAGAQAPYAYDEETERNWESVTTDARMATEGYFESAGIRLKQGRFFDERDDGDGRLVVLVDEVLARKAWPGQEAVGQRLMLPVVAPDGVRREWFEVVGVVEHARLHELSRDGREQVYLPFRQRPSRSTDVLIRTESDPATFTAQAAKAVHEIDEDLPVHNPRPLTSYTSESMAELRFTMTVGAIFGVAALLLASIAIYGLISYSVSLRARELSVRRALGARESGILRLVMGEGLLLTLLGIATGGPIALVAARALSTMLFGVSAVDPWTFVLVLVVLVAVSALACYFPARRAIRASPLLALRHE